MATYYSILTAIIRPEIQERISIGLLLMGDEGVHFNYSTNKMAAVRTILHENDYKLFKDYVQMVVAKVSEIGKQKQQISLDKNYSVINEPYINYLSRYNNNLLSFTPTKSIDVPSTDDIFIKLFHKFIDNIDQSKPIEQKRTFEAFRRKNEQILKSHYTIEKEIYNKELPGLIAPVKVDLIGMNEIPVYAQSIEMDRNVYHIENDIAKLLFLRDAFGKKFKHRTEFIVSSEPQKTQVKQHAIWKNLRTSHEFTYLDESEAGKIIEYAEQHGVKPLI
ncbi:MAG: hypothetical protein V4620_09975 [Bacteroidota bacterium]